MATSKINTTIASLQSHLYNFALLLTSNRDEAYDLFKDTTLRAIDNSNCHMENGRLRGWLFTIMRNIFIHNYRRISNFAEVAQAADELHVFALPSASHADSPEGTVSLNDLSSALEMLSSDLRTPFELYASGHSYAEISTETGQPIYIVKRRIHTCNRHLRLTLVNLR